MWLDRLVGADDVGTQISVVLMKDSTDGEVWCGLAHGQRFRFGGGTSYKVGDKMTFHCWIVTGFGVDGDVLLNPSSDSAVFSCGPGTADSRTTLSCCSGLGGIILGSSWAGFATQGMNDISPLASKSLAANFGPGVVTGDLACPRVARDLHQLCEGISPILEAGFPCQPYSVLGDRRGSADERAAVLTSILRLGWLTQCGGVVLECVPGASADQWVRSTLSAFATKMGFQTSDGILHLERFWPSRRSRWWWVATPSAWKSIEIHDLPRSGWQKLSDILKEWPVWDVETESSLQWTQDELKYFRDVRFGPDSRRLNMSGQAPTALHSIGAHFRACPCGCRGGKFSDARLAQGGLHSIEIRSARDPTVARHPHPQELGFLQGIDLRYRYQDPPVDQLCLIGQVASPFQSAWIFLLVAQSMPDSDMIDPEGFLLLLGHELVAQSQERWLFPSDLGRFEVQVDSLEGAPIRFFTTQFSTAFDFASAQAKLEKAADIQVWRSGRIASPDALLKAGNFFSVSDPAASDQQDIEVVLHWRGRQTTIRCRAGSYVFEILGRAGISEEVVVFRHASDERLPGDQPIWESSTFEIGTLLRGGGGPTLTALQHILKSPDMQRWHSERRADGQIQAGFDAGLDDVTVTYAARELILLSGITNVHFVSPRTVTSWLEQGADSEVDLVGKELSTFDGTRVIALIGRKNHWVLLDYELFDNGAECTLIDGYEEAPDKEFAWVGNLIHEFFGSGPLSQVRARCFDQKDTTSCGAIALLHLGWRLCMWTSFTSAEVASWYSLLRWGVAAPRFHGGGRSEVQTAVGEWLSPFLIAKGVPASAVDDRIAQAVRIFGVDRLAAAAKSRNPWASLKSLGNSQSRPFLWVKYEELRSHIEARGKEQWGASIDIPKRKGRGQTRKNEPALDTLVDPGKLILVKGVLQGGGHEIGQLALSEVRSGAIGAAFCRPDDATHFLQERKFFERWPPGTPHHWK